MTSPYLTDYLFNAARFFVGFILMILALRAYLKTRTSPMIYLTAGFTLITVGDLLSAVYYIEDVHMYKLFSQTFDIIGLIALIIAVEKS